VRRAPIWIAPRSVTLTILAACLIGLASSARAGDESHLAQKKNERTALERAEDLLAEGKYSAAKSAFDAAFLTGDESAALFGGRGAARIGLGDIDGGIADLREAIRVNPGDLGKEYRPNADVVLPKAALEHGEKQVRQMLKERPLMAEHVEEGDALWRWAVRKFAGEDLDATIDWDSTPPREASADHSTPTESRRGSIRVSKYAAYDKQSGPEASFDELWNRAVFELHNIMHRREFLRAWEEAWDGKLTEEAFVARTCAAEHKALQQTRAFYVQVYLPWAKRREAKTRARTWDVLWWGRPEDAIKEYHDKNSYPWRPYVRYFLQVQTLRLLAQESYDKAIASAKQYLQAARFPDEKADAHCYLAEAYLEQGDIERAQRSLAACKRVAPDDYDNAHLKVVEIRLLAKSGKINERKPSSLEPGWLDLVELYKDKA
jgi:tetratricopeptide (TPR) repeat protein